MKINPQILRLFQQKITGFSKSQLFLNPELSKDQEDILKKYIERLQKWEPVEYIIGSAIFYGYDFFVDNRVLIPRNDTEVMVEQVLTCNFKHLIDVGTGSWAIGITVTKERTLSSTTLLDLHNSALSVARKNAKQHNIKANIIQSNLLEQISNLKPYTLITANLPYIKNNDFCNVDKETQEFEPATALYGWPDTGFELYQELIDQIVIKWENKRIILFIEIWFDQSKYAKRYLLSKNLDFEVFKDNWWIERCIKIAFY